MKCLQIVSIDNHYPRNELVRRVLMTRDGVCEIQAKKGLVGNVRVILQLVRKPRGGVVLFLQPPQWMLLALFFAKMMGAVVIVDMFIFLEDTFIGDRRLASASSMKAKYYRFLDWCSAVLADVLLFDTIENRDFFMKKHISIGENKARILPVCVDMTLFPRWSPHQGKTFTVLFYGKYIPLQGIGYIVDAALILHRYETIHFVLIGSGQDRASIDSKVAEYGLQNISFRESVSYEELIKLLVTADVSLGIFGLSDKADRVIPNKVVEAAACGVPIITGENTAMARYFSHGKSILFCKRGDGASLADMILYAMQHPGMLSRISKNGLKVAQEHFSKESIESIFGEYLYDDEE